MQSLARRFLWTIGATAVFVTALASLATFLTFKHELEQRQIDFLSQYVQQRDRQEQRRFSDLNALHAEAAKALARRMRLQSQADVDRTFDAFFPLQPDGTRRSPDSAFNGRVGPDGRYDYGLGAYLRDGAHITEAEKRIYVAAWSVVSRFGEASHGSYDNFYFFTPQNRLIMFGPDRPDHLMFYRKTAPPDLDISHEQMTELTLKTVNPWARTRCTNLQQLIQQKDTERWGTGCVTPIDFDGRRIGAFGTTIQLNGFFSKAVANTLPHAKNLIVTSQGELIAYPGLTYVKAQGAQKVAAFEKQYDLKGLVARIKVEGRETGVIKSADGKAYIAYGRLDEPDWYLLIAYPVSRVAESAALSASWVLGLGLLAVLLQTAMAVAVARRYIVRPLTCLARPGGHPDIARIERRRDEIGVLARALRSERERADEAVETLEGRVRDRTAQLEQALEEKSRFLANMSHELRTPLNGVIAVSEMLSRAQTEPKNRELAELIVASGRLLEQVLTDILDFSKLEAGQMRLEHADLDMTLLVSRIAELHRAAAEAKGLKLTWRIDPSAQGRWIGDGVRLTQILSNLLSNAVKFTAAGEICLEAEATGHGLHFSVRDTGIGFDEEVASRLFQRFEQADASITRRFGGTGLGLSICRALAELMGGAMTVRSAPGMGSTFSLTVPLERANAAAVTETDDEAPAEAPLQNARILLAEDHPTNQKVVKMILESCGVDLAIVETGLQALQALEHEHFDLVLMDMQMPEMDGLTATRRLRERERETGAARTPVVMLTANALDEHVAAGREAGADLHLAKPIRTESLLNAIAQALSSREPEGAELAA